jgi:hypothetical protein
MKKFFMFFMLLMVPIMVFCQMDSTAVANPTIPVPTDIISVFADLKGWFASTTGIAGLTIFFTVMVSKLWTTIPAIWKQVIAIGIALLLMTIGNLANFGFMAEFNWISTITYGLMVGFTANGLYDAGKNLAKK